MAALPWLLLLTVASGSAELQLISPPCQSGLYETTLSRRTLAGAENGSSFIVGVGLAASFKAPQSLALSFHPRFGSRATALVGTSQQGVSYMIKPITS